MQMAGGERGIHTNKSMLFALQKWVKSWAILAKFIGYFANG